MESGAMSIKKLFPQQLIPILQSIDIEHNHEISDKIAKEVGMEGYEVRGQASDLIFKFIDEYCAKHRQEKNWNKCPYWRHSDDCDCEGFGGDR